MRRLRTWLSGGLSWLGDRFYQASFVIEPPQLSDHAGEAMRVADCVEYGEPYEMPAHRRGGTLSRRPMPDTDVDGAE